MNFIGSTTVSSSQIWIVRNRIQTDLRTLTYTTVVCLLFLEPNKIKSSIVPTAFPRPTNFGNRSLYQQLSGQNNGAQHERCRAEGTDHGYVCPTIHSFRQQFVLARYR
jgi:hypothetical protein